MSGQVAIFSICRFDRHTFIHSNIKCILNSKIKPITKHKSFLHRNLFRLPLHIQDDAVTILQHTNKLQSVSSR